MMRQCHAVITDYYRMGLLPPRYAGLLLGIYIGYHTLNIVNSLRLL